MTTLPTLDVNVQLVARIDDDHFLVVMVPDPVAVTTFAKLLLYVVPIYDADATPEPYYYEPLGLPVSPLEAYLDSQEDRGHALRKAVKGRAGLPVESFAVASGAGYFHTIHGSLLRFPEKFTDGRTNRYLWLPRTEDYLRGSSRPLDAQGIMGLYINPTTYELRLELPLVN